MKHSIVLLFIVLNQLSNSIYGQRPVYTEDEIIVQTVINEVDLLFKSKDFLQKKEKKYNDITGSMIVDIGVIHSGKVSTFYNVESTITNIDFINFMSDYILKHKFKFKLPKKSRHKIRYTITF